MKIIIFLLLSVMAFGQSQLLLLMDDDGEVNNQIGIPGTQGFGVGTVATSDLPAYIVPLTGTNDVANDNYGNYMVTTDSSIMCWIPIFYYKITNVTAAPYYGNKIEIRGYDYYGLDTALAADDGYAIHRAFIDGGQLKKGFFIDKYGWSLTNYQHGVSGIASSRKNGNPISSSNATNRTAVNNYAGSFSDCISNSQVPADNYGGAWAVAKTRGSNFSLMTMFQNSALAMLSMAHQQAASGTTYCAWNDVLPYAPKGNNRSGVLNDQNDATVTWSNPTDSYWAGRNEAAQTGSANPFAKSTHNGQGCGVADINGNQWRIVQGITAAVTIINISGAVSTDGGTKVQIATASAHGLNVGDWVMPLSVVGMTDLNGKLFTVTNVVATDSFKVTLATAQTYTSGGNISKGSFYVLKESVAVKNLLQGNTTSSHHFGTNGITANFDVLYPEFVDGGINAQKYGNSTNQLISSLTTRTNNLYKLSGLGMPMASNSVNTSGTNSFGQDYYNQYLRDEMCAFVGGSWISSTDAGVWAVVLSNFRTSNTAYVSARSCLYL